MFIIDDRFSKVKMYEKESIVPFPLSRIKLFVQVKYKNIQFCSTCRYMPHLYCIFHQEMITVKCDTVSTEKVSSNSVIKKTLRGSVFKNCSNCNMNGMFIYTVFFFCQNGFPRYRPLDSHKKYSICNNSNQKYCMIFFKDKIEIKNTV